MSNEILCPICETPNKPSATNCEVCGERLTPPAPGETLSPEESVAAMLAANPPQPTPAPAPAASAGGFAMDEEDEFDELMGDASFKTEPMAAVPAAPAPALAAAPGKPNVLYSPVSGQAFGRGTPEWAEGFGPLGEELVATPPAAAAPAPPAPAPVPDRAPAPPIAVNPGPVQPTPAPTPAPVAPAPAPTPAPSPAPVAVNPGPVQPTPAPVAPAPAPRPSTQPASVTVYHQRQPVVTHHIQTDETLIGRRDVRSDVYPDIDLTQYDPNGNVSRKHAYIYRQNREYSIYVVSNGGVQVGNQLVELGGRHILNDGDVIIVAGIIAMKFQLG